MKEHIFKKIYIILLFTPNYVLVKLRVYIPKALSVQDKDFSLNIFLLI